MVFVILCPGTPEGSTGSGSGFKESQKTGQRLKVSSDRLGEAGNRTCDPWFTRHRFIPYTTAKHVLTGNTENNHFLGGGYILLKIIIFEGLYIFAKNIFERLYIFEKSFLGLCIIKNNLFIYLVGGG